MPMQDGELAAVFDQFGEKIAGLSEQEQAAFVLWARRQMTRDRLVAAYSSPAYLAASIEPGYVVTPAIDLIGREVEAATTQRRARLLITCPPQEGKSSLVAVWAVLRVLQRNPDTRIILASYSQGLAEQASSTARNLIAAHGSDARDPLTGVPMPDQLGLSLAGDKAQAAHWRIKGHRGGVVAVGMGGTITGRPADLLLIDDPLKGMAAADSPTERRKVIEGFQGDLTTRLAPGAAIVLIQTRWHEDDLAGWLLKQDATRPAGKRLWRHVNIPAVAEQGVPDALGRAQGEPMVSARGRTADDWQETREAVGERVWAALYQGVPVPASGGMFGIDWFERFRLGQEPALYRRVVAIDPAETGKGDEAGIVAGGVAESGTIVLTDDWSGHMTSDEWARKACLLALSIGAQELVYEAYATATTYRRVLTAAFTELQAEAADGDGTVDGVTIPPAQPYRVVPWTGSGNAEARSAGLRQAVATGRCRTVGHRLATFEHLAIAWQGGRQHQPDRVAAATIVFDHLAGHGRVTLAAPTSGDGLAGGWGVMPTGLSG